VEVRSGSGGVAVAVGTTLTAITTATKKLPALKSFLIQIELTKPL